MKGYLSFLLVFASFALILSLLELHLASRSIDLSKALVLERTYQVQMNVKESMIESARQGAVQGFNNYDSSHNIIYCKHCPDNFCIPPTPIDPLPPNFCSALLCQKCFREPDARAAAEAGAAWNTGLITNHRYDDLIEVIPGQVKISAFTKKSVLSGNGFTLDFLRFRDNVPIGLVSGNVKANAAIPEAFVITYD